MKSRKTLIALLLALVMILSFSACGDNAATTPADTAVGEGVTTVKFTVKVIHADKSEKKIEVNTTKTNLGDALVDKGIIVGTTGVYGLYIDTVDGETADYDENQSWWCVTKGGEYVSTGVDNTPIVSGDVFELTYKIGY